MVPPPFVHGLSIDFTFSMDKPWRNHGQTMEKGPFMSLLMWLDVVHLCGYKVKPVLQKKQ
ncbi:MAG: hypothetical protein N4A37_05560 [Prolixibacteraceae bacterium]|nr:hypothetical protein [Prolixibacteraceae bacterium]